MVPDAALRDMGVIAQLLVHVPVTRLTGIPAVLEALVQECARRGSPCLPNLVCVVSSGAPLRRDAAVAILRTAPRARLLNLYGSTETTVMAVASRLLFLVPPIAVSVNPSLPSPLH